MTQPPLPPAGTPEPGATPPPPPSFGSVPPASPYAAPTPPSYAAPTTPPPGSAPQGPPPGAQPFGSEQYTPPPAAKSGKSKLRIIGGIGAAIIVILLKFGAVFGIGSALFHGAEHRADEAEDSVRSFLKADTEAEAAPYVAPGLEKHIDPACASVMKSATTFKIPKAKKTSDTTADVTVDITGASTDVHFHVTETSGKWLIDQISCS
ncbi:hypothetical protein [Nocardioides montaniterrae]